MKLRHAKCLSCGENIDVCERNEKIKCQYCGKSMLSKDAIEEYEISMIENEDNSTKGVDDYVKDAAKHLKLNEFKEAIESSRKAISLDNSNVDALALELRAYIAIVEQCHKNNFDFLKTSVYTSSDWASVRDIQSMYEHLLEVAKRKKREIGKVLPKKITNQIQDMFDSYEDSLKDYNICKEIISIIDEYRKTFKHSFEKEAVDQYLSETLGTSGTFHQCRIASIPTGGKVKFETLEEFRDYLNANYDELKTYIKEKTKNKVSNTEMSPTVNKTSKTTSFITKKSVFSIALVIIFIVIIVLAIFCFKG